MLSRTLTWTLVSASLSPVTYFFSLLGYLEYVLSCSLCILCICFGDRLFLLPRGVRYTPLSASLVPANGFLTGRPFPAGLAGRWD